MTSHDARPLDLRPLGRSGLTVSTLGLGGNNFGRPDTPTETLEGTRAVVDAALESGITFIDTADCYGREPGLSEHLLGEVLAGRRERVLIATKFGHSELDGGVEVPAAKGSRAYIRRAVDNSLRRLQTDWIDLYQMHSPDPVTPLEETLAALDELVREGKVRYIGHSNFSAWQLAEAELIARMNGFARPISAQNEYNLIARDADRDLLPAAAHFGVGFLPWFPLHNGLFTGAFSREGGPADSRIMRIRRHLVDEAPWDAMDAYGRFCAERGVTMLEATFAWLLAQPALASVIAGATRPEQIRQNAAAVQAWTPSAAEVADIGAFFAPTTA